MIEGCKGKEADASSKRLVRLQVCGINITILPLSTNGGHFIGKHAIYRRKGAGLREDCPACARRRLWKVAPTRGVRRFATIYRDRLMRLLGMPMLAHRGSIRN